MANSETAAVLFKGRMMTLTVLEIRDHDPDAVRDAVAEHVMRSPGFFSGMPVLLSLGTPAVDLDALKQVLIEADLVPVGVLDADAQIAAAARAVGLGVLESPANRGNEAASTPENGSRDKRRSGRSRSAAGHNGTDAAPTRVVTRPVRSGQQIYARGGDLIVLSAVSEGAEVVADGHIHIYGSLRGRALAGAQGDANARIFCRRFEPDLIAVAGCYKVADAIDEDVRGACVQVALEGDNLLIELQE